LKAKEKNSPGERKKAAAISQEKGDLKGERQRLGVRVLFQGGRGRGSPETIHRRREIHLPLRGEKGKRTRGRETKSRARSAIPRTPGLLKKKNPGSTGITTIYP